MSFDDTVTILENRCLSGGSLFVSVNGSVFVSVEAKVSFSLYHALSAGSGFVGILSDFVISSGNELYCKTREGCILQGCLPGFANPNCLSGRDRSRCNYFIALERQ